MLSLDIWRRRIRLQSAVEYITTYGWALLIIMVVIAVLFELGLFSPSFTAQECVISADFNCLSYFMAENGLLTINFQQTTQNPINVTGLACTQNTTSYRTYVPSSTANQITMLIDSNYTFQTSCRWANTTVVFDKAGTVYSGNLEVNFTDLNTGFRHTDFGKIVVRSS